MGLQVGNITVNGVAMAAGAFYLDGRTNTFQPLSAPILVGPDGQPRVTTEGYDFGLYVYDNVSFYYIVPVQLADVHTYDITIEAAPGTEVKRSECEFTGNFVILNDSVKETIVIPSNGTVMKRNIQGQGQTDIYWCQMSIMDLINNSAGLKVTTTLSVDIGGIGKPEGGSGGGSTGGDTGGGNTGGGNTGGSTGGNTGGGNTGGSTGGGNTGGGTVNPNPTPPEITEKRQFCGRMVKVPKVKCGTCGGDDSNTCTNCDGSGRIDINGELTDCASCGGTGKVSCGVCNNGYIETLTDFSVTVTRNAESTLEAIIFSRWKFAEQFDASTITQTQVNLLYNEYQINNDPLDVSGGSNSTHLNLTPEEEILVWGVATKSGDGFEITFSPTSGTVDSGDNNSCLTGDTLITLSNGLKKRLDQLSIGEWLKTQNGISQITRIAKGSYHPNHVAYEFEDGTIINEVNIHPFYNVEHGYFKCLCYWDIGDHAVNENGEHIKLINKTVVPEDTEQYCVWTNDSSYYANGLLSGDLVQNREYLKDMSIEQILDLAESLDASLVSSLLSLGELEEEI